jgi:hypothetical protein
MALLTNEKNGLADLSNEQWGFTFFKQPWRG